MSPLASVKTAFRALQAHKLRATLTALGIIIGVAAVIAMVAIAQGASAAVQARITSLGTNVLIVKAWKVTLSGARAGAGDARRLTVKDVEAVARECSAVSQVAPVDSEIAQLIYGSKNWNTRVEGTTPDYQVIRDWPVSAGDFFTSRDVDAAAKVAVLGQVVARNLFEDDDPIGKIIRVGNMQLKVIGVLASKGGEDRDDVVLTPFSTAERKVFPRRHLGRVRTMYASAVSAEAIPEAKEQITNLLRKRLRLRPEQKENFTVRTLADVIATAEATSSTMTLLLGSIAFISLLVGGIGIMNIMLVSVTERTREIGIRLAVGAQEAHILWQFLIEAVALSLIGGVIGIAIGVSASKIISSIAGWPTLISLDAVALAFGASMSVGIFFGLYPARKASRLDPVEALHYE
ncbi:MAG TPA: ABC transporter permease [Candidatus Tectomicrobia bacterium]|nr:ABC transporter permease [Candidatus Tectomicrobia bacterium]